MNLLPNILRGWGGVWLAVCLLLGGIVAFQAVALWTDDSVQQLVHRELKPRPEPELEMAQREEYQLPILSHYKEVVERPLFLAGRRPVEEDDDNIEEEAVAEVGKTVRLTSIIITPKRRYVLLQEQKGKREVRRVEQGQRFNGWDVAEILPDRVLFRQGKKEESLELRVYKKFTAPVRKPKPIRKNAAKRKAATARAKGPKKKNVATRK